MIYHVRTEMRQSLKHCQTSRTGIGTAFEIKQNKIVSINLLFPNKKKQKQKEKKRKKK